MKLFPIPIEFLLFINEVIANLPIEFIFIIYVVFAFTCSVFYSLSMRLLVGINRILGSTL